MNSTTALYLPGHEPSRQVGRSRQEGAWAGNGKFVTMAIFTPKQIKAGFKAVPNWSQRSKTIGRTCLFDGNMQRLAFVNHLALERQKNNHYKEMDLKFDRSTLTLTPPGEGGITEKNFALARQ